MSKLSVLPSPSRESVNVHEIIEKEKPLISVVMPAYNEREHITDAIRSVVKQLDGLGYKCEIVVVDDGSTDGTFNVIKKLELMNLKVIRFSKNQGKGFALRYGLMLPQSRYEAPFFRKLLSHLFQVLVKIVVGVKATDTQSGLKAGRARPLKRIFSLLSVKRYAFDVELLTVAQLLNYRFVEMPVDISMSAWFSPIEALRMFIDLLGIAYRLKVRKWYQRNIRAHELQTRDKVVA